MNLIVADETALKSNSENILKTELKPLIEAADYFVNIDVNPITNKRYFPDYCSKNDYVSLATYFWPDENIVNGIPYINRDGYVNPLGRNSDYYDRGRLDEMANAVFTLSTAYFYSGQEKYKKAAENHLDAWFVDENTRMNPSLEYAQGIPGICLGRDIGIIDMQYIIELIDSAILIDYSNKEQFALWCKKYLNWLLTSENGKGECEKHNNHSIWYDAQIMSLADFCGMADIVVKTAKRTEKRFFEQIKEDGSFPKELSRTRSYMYSLFALQGAIFCAIISNRYNVDLWNAPIKSGVFKKCFDFILPFMYDFRKWEHTQIDDVPAWKAAICMNFANRVYSDQRYYNAAKKVYINQNEYDVRLFRYPLTDF